MTLRISTSKERKGTNSARPIADAVRAHGVARVVAVSSLGRGYTRPAGQLSAAWAMDDMLETSGAAYRSMQPPFFMENIARQATLIRERDEFALTSAPDQPHPTVAVADVASAAAELLADRTWTGQQGVPVRGPVDHTPREMAGIMSDVLGRQISYRQIGIDDYRTQLASRGASPAVVGAMIEMAQAQWDGVYPPVEQGNGGTTFEIWCLRGPALLGQRC
ncbi:NAD(P)H-binding protein [Streptomyces sp. NPDC005525]|uniref:NAD(P)H-binding protein n=1 Tax=Streptomyces sp. NPDC005525 TaxID=3364720 RepID=UPI0036BB1342